MQEMLIQMIRDPARLTAVRRCGLLDDAPEEIFDQLTRLAAETLCAQAAFISVVDDRSDFYKSFFGFSGSLAVTRRLEGETFCHHALLADGMLVIEDARRDDVYCSVPTIQSLGVIAYLGIPLHTPDGHAVGAFCVIDEKPRQWTPRDLTTACLLARAVVREIAVRCARGSDAATSNDAPVKLSPREREVMLRIVAGQRIKQIALDLGLSEKTVATHRARLLKRLGLADNRALYRYALALGLLDWNPAPEQPLRDDAS